MTDIDIKSYHVDNGTGNILELQKCTPYFLLFSNTYPEKENPSQNPIPVQTTFETWKQTRSLKCSSV